MEQAEDGSMELGLLITLPRGVPVESFVGLLRALEAIIRQFVEAVGLPGEEVAIGIGPMEVASFEAEAAFKAVIRWQGETWDCPDRWEPKGWDDGLFELVCTGYHRDQLVCECSAERSAECWGKYWIAMAARDAQGDGAASPPGPLSRALDGGRQDACPTGLEEVENGGEGSDAQEGGEHEDDSSPH